MATEQTLRQVRFYTPLDPYYYTADNRPLEDLAARDLELARAVDLVTGGSERASMAAASIGQALIGRNAYAGTYLLAGGLVVRFNYGFAIKEFTDQVNPSLLYPKMAVHDAVTSFTEITAATTPGRAIKYLVQAKFEIPTESSRIPSAGSDTMVCTLTLKNSAEYVNDGQSTPVVLPDVDGIGVMEIIVPYGKTTLTQGDVTLLNYVDIEQIMQIVNNGPVDPTDVRIKKVRHEVSLAKGAQHIPLGGTEIDLNKGEDNISVYLTGLFQHNFTVDKANNRITLGGTLPEAAEVMVTQDIPVPKGAA